MHTVGLAAEDAGRLRLCRRQLRRRLPYWLRFGGRDQLIVPYTLDANDMRFATPQGFNSGYQFEAYLKDSFDILYAEGLAGAPKMLSIGLHCRLVGRPGRAAALKRALDYMRAHDGVWFATRLEIAEHWAATHPARDRRAPSRWTATLSSTAFGGIFEHSPWIAERAHALELGPTHDTARGVHSALARIFRTASEEERLGVLEGASRSRRASSPPPSA
jgi:hypothetical protein